MTKSKLIGALALALSVTLVPSLSSSPAYAVDNMNSGDTVDLTSVRAKIKAENYKGALEELRGLAEDSQQADVYNLLGFTLRKTGDYETSLTYYTKALDLQPDHKGAHEYLGELFVETGKLDKAKDQLAALEKLCPNGCEERDDLQNVIAAKVAAK